MCGRQQEEKQGRKAELFYLESVLSGRPLDQIYTSDLWGFHLVPERATERGNAEEGQANRTWDGTLSTMSEWHGERPECCSVNTAPHSEGKRKSHPAQLHPSHRSPPGCGGDRWVTARLRFESLHIHLDELRGSDSDPTGQRMMTSMHCVGEKGAGLQPELMDMFRVDICGIASQKSIGLAAKSITPSKTFNTHFQH